MHEMHIEDMPALHSEGRCYSKKMIVVRSRGCVVLVAKACLFTSSFFRLSHLKADDRGIRLLLCIGVTISPCNGNIYVRPAAHTLLWFADCMGCQVMSVSP